AGGAVHPSDGRGGADPAQSRRFGEQPARGRGRLDRLHRTPGVRTVESMTAAEPVSGRYRGPAVPIGLSTASVYPQTAESAFRYAADLGFDGVELMVWAEQEIGRASCRESVGRSGGGGVNEERERGG